MRHYAVLAIWLSAVCVSVCSGQGLSCRRDPYHRSRSRRQPARPARALGGRAARPRPRSPRRCRQQARGGRQHRHGSGGQERAGRRTRVIVDNGTLTQNPHIYRRPGYDARADFAPVIVLIEASLLLAVPAASPVRKVSDLVALARATLAQLSYGSPGIATPPHLAGELFSRAAASSARSGSSPWATGAPNNASTASPRYLATKPP